MPQGEAFGQLVLTFVRIVRPGPAFNRIRTSSSGFIHANRQHVFLDSLDRRLRTRGDGSPSSDEKIVACDTRLIHVEPNRVLLRGHCDRRRYRRFRWNGGRYVFRGSGTDFVLGRWCGSGMAQLTEELVSSTSA